MRLFFALPIPTEARERIRSALPQKIYSGIRFTFGENFHVTVHFLGEVEDEKLEKIISAGAEISGSLSSFELKFDSLKIISSERKPAMIWAQFEVNNSFDTLCQKLREIFPTEESRKPIPHITLARIRQLKELPFELPSVGHFSFPVTNLELWKSLTKPEGAVYTAMESWRLK